MTKRLLIVRHAERPPISKGDIGNDLALTEAGKQATMVFAKALHEDIVSIHSSPVPRCMQTAQLIAKAHGYDPQKIQSNQLLGNPGAFIKDPDIAWQNWLAKGNEAVNIHLLRGTKTWSGFHPFDKAMTTILSGITATFSEHKSGLIVWITHDTILAAFASRVLPQPLSTTDWPDFLGYLQVKPGANEQLEFSYSKVQLAPQP